MYLKSIPKNKVLIKIKVGGDHNSSLIELILISLSDMKYYKDIFSPIVLQWFLIRRSDNHLGQVLLIEISEKCHGSYKLHYKH